MQKSSLTCPHCGKDNDSKPSGIDLIIHLPGDMREEFRKLAYAYDCGSLQVFANHIFRETVNWLWLIHKLEEKKELYATEPSEAGSNAHVRCKELPLKITENEIDMLATIAEKDGCYDLEEYANKRFRDALHEDWMLYEISIVHGILKTQEGEL